MQDEPITELQVLRSQEGTLRHIRQVQANLNAFCIELLKRGEVHDDSKLEEPERSGYARLHHELAGLTYGSPEYMTNLARLRHTVEHHFARNSHHAEYHCERGMSGMTLWDLVEMFCDWQAAVRRHNNGNLYNSLEVNTKRYGIDPMLTAILKNTIDAIEQSKEPQAPPKESP